ncbi:flagellar brake protein [Herminiimonas sp. CN]|uniref:flagellar brake protein n=1 Tax=Herminiimonas sp. CN TaxID=1349818 RepID=UPI00047362A3|nr:flagellar brake protein [Herminiimonas sp. CN]
MISFDDIKLAVGTRMQITLRRGAQPLIYYTTLIGYVSGEYLLLKIPFEHGLAVPLQNGEDITVRVFSGMSVFTFSCSVDSIFLSPRFYMHLTFPSQIQATALRKAVRVKVQLPVHIRGTEEHGTITDLSVVGAQIIADVALGQPEAKIPLSFSFQIKPGNQEVLIETRATIRSQRMLPATKKGGPARFLYGVLFDDLDPTNQAMLQNLIYESLLGLPAIST